MEAMHVVTTHPQLLASIGDANTQYDAFENYSRAMTANNSQYNCDFISCRVYGFLAQPVKR